MTDDDFPSLAPRPVDMVHQLHTALYGESWARPESPAKVWADLLAEVKASRRYRIWIETMLDDDFLWREQGEDRLRWNVRMTLRGALDNTEG